MSSAEKWVCHARERLDSAGFRSSAARNLIIDVLSEQHCCIGAQQLHGKLEGSTGLASVYRTLDLLEELALVRRVDVAGVACYEPADPSGDHHHHLVCQHCDAIELFDDPELEAVLTRISANVSYSRVEHEVTLRGICTSCKQPNEVKEKKST